MAATDAQVESKVPSPEATSEVVEKEAVVLDFSDLSKPSEELKEAIEAAFGCVVLPLAISALHPTLHGCVTLAPNSYDGLGIIAITNVPEYLEKRKVLLPLARECVPEFRLRFLMPR